MHPIQRPPQPPRGCESCSFFPGSKSGRKPRPRPPAWSQNQALPPGAESLLCLSFSIPQTSSPCPCHRPGPPRRGPLCYPCLVLASQVTAIKINSKYIQIPLSDIREGDGARAGQLARPPQDTGLCLVGQDPAVAGNGLSMGGDLVSPALSPLAPQAPAGFPPPARKALKFAGFGTHR